MGTRQILEDNAATAFKITFPLANPGDEPTARVSVREHTSAPLFFRFGWIWSCFVWQIH